VNSIEPAARERPWYEDGLEPEERTRRYAAIILQQALDPTGEQVLIHPAMYRQKEKT